MDVEVGGLTEKVQDVLATHGLEGVEISPYHLDDTLGESSLYVAHTTQEEGDQIQQIKYPNVFYDGSTRKTYVTGRDENLRKWESSLEDIYAVLSSPNLRESNQVGFTAGGQLAQEDSVEHILRNLAKVYTTNKQYKKEPTPQRQVDDLSLDKQLSIMG